MLMVSLTLNAVIKAAQVVLINESIPNLKAKLLPQSDNLNTKLQTVLSMLRKEEFCAVYHSFA